MEFHNYPRLKVGLMVTISLSHRHDSLQEMRLANYQRLFGPRVYDMPFDSEYREQRVPDTVDGEQVSDYAALLELLPEAAAAFTKHFKEKREERGEIYFFEALNILPEVREDGTLSIKLDVITRKYTKDETPKPQSETEQPGA